MTVPSRARTAYAAVGVVLPLAATAVSVAAQLVWLPQLPDPIAVHWSGSGAPDGFGPVWSLPLLTGLVGVGITALLGAMVWGSLRAGVWSTAQRFLGTIVAGFVTFLAVALTFSAGMQIGIADAADGPGAAGALLAGAAAGVVAAIVAWFLLPRPHEAHATPAPHAAPLALRDGERAAWLRTATMSRGILVLAFVAIALPLVIAVVFAPLEAGVTLIAAASALGVGMLVAATTAFRVRVDATGVTVRSLLGVPRMHVSLDDITGAAVTHVEPLAQFGGWGLRWAADGRFGVILRRGEALEVRRIGRGAFVVTVDDAATAAGLLQALAVRA